MNLLLQTLALQIVQLVVFREQRGILLRVGKSRLKLEQTRCVRRCRRQRERGGLTSRWAFSASSVTRRSCSRTSSNSLQVRQETQQSSGIIYQHRLDYEINDVYALQNKCNENDNGIGRDCFPNARNANRWTRVNKRTTYGTGNDCSSSYQRTSVECYCRRHSLRSMSSSSSMHLIVKPKPIRCHPLPMEGKLDLVARLS